MPYTTISTTQFNFSSATPRRKGLDWKIYDSVAQLSVVLDGSYVRAHQVVARGRGGPKKRDWAELRWVTTRIHAATNSHGKPLFSTISCGTVNDIRVAPSLVKRLPACHCIADLGYCSNMFRNWLKSQGVKPVIPSYPCRKQLQPLDRRLYRRRFCVEELVHRLGFNRRAATRYEKRAKSFLGVLKIAYMTVLAILRTLLN